MNIPRSFKLLGQTIRVRYDPLLVNSNDNRGEARFRTNEIVLQSQSEGVPIPQEQIEHTFCHELVHHIFHSMGENKLRDDERIVDVFAGHLHQALTTSEYEE